jgi:hypothetical protein
MTLQTEYQRFILLLLQGQLRPWHQCVKKDDATAGSLYTSASF